jgi:hypothetical protein
MNSDLIKRLAEKAYVAASIEQQFSDPTSWYSDRGAPAELVNQKFAELIIQECCTRIQADWQKVEQMLVQDPDFEPLAIIAACRTECVAEIKQHWGIPS